MNFFVLQRNAAKVTTSTSRYRKIIVHGSYILALWQSPGRWWTRRTWDKGRCGREWAYSIPRSGKSLGRETLFCTQMFLVRIIPRQGPMRVIMQDTASICHPRSSLVNGCRLTNCQSQEPRYPSRGERNHSLSFIMIMTRPRRMGLVPLRGPDTGQLLILHNGTFPCSLYPQRTWILHEVRTNTALLHFICSSYPYWRAGVRDFHKVAHELRQFN